MMKRNYLFSDNHDKSVSFDDKEHFDSLGHTIYYSTVPSLWSKVSTLSCTKQPNMPAIHEQLSSLLLALPSGLLGATQKAQDTQFAQNKPILAFCEPSLASARQQTGPKTSRGDSPKRVSWADEYSSGSSGSSPPRSRALHVADSEHPMRTRLQGFATAEQKTRAHVERARMASAHVERARMAHVKVMF